MKLKTGTLNGQSNIAYSQDNKGSYQFAYEISDKKGASNFRQETGGPTSVKGSYGLTDVDGRTRLVNYQADKYGFVATVDTNEPGTGHEDTANVVFNGLDKGKGWGYAVAVQDIRDNNKKVNDPNYQSQSHVYLNNQIDKKTHTDEEKIEEKSEEKNEEKNEENPSEKNYERKDEYKNTLQADKTIMTTNSPEIVKKDEISNVNNESGGTFEAPTPTSSETEKAYDGQKSNQEELTETEDSGNADEEQYDKKQISLVGVPKDTKSEYLNTIEKLAKEKNQTPIYSDLEQNIPQNKNNTEKLERSFKIIHLNRLKGRSWNPKKYIKLTHL